MKRKKRDMIVDGFMMDNDRQGEDELYPAEDPTVAGYYLDIEVDDEIDPAILTKAMQSGRFADIRDLESFASTMTIGAGEDAMLSKLGNSATNIYGLSLSEIASMSEEALDMAQTRAGQLAGLYDEEDKTNGCD